MATLDAATSVPDSAQAPPALGDMPPEEFRRHAHAAVDWMADYLAGVERFPVLSQVQPGDVASQVPAAAPVAGEDFTDVLADVDRVVMPGITHWNHPGFHAYFAITGSAPGIIGEMMAAALNVNGMLWRSSPAVTELEERALDWLRQLIGLPEVFRGTIQDTASISTLVAVCAAREAAGLDVREQGMSGRELPRLRMYCSEEAHSSVERAGIVAGIAT